MVFAMSAIFACILWDIECEECILEYGSAEAAEAALPGQCTYYEWWKYIVGNLVGVEALTEVGPESDHVVAEMVDILIAVWSLTITGLVIGIVGSLGFVKSAQKKSERSLNNVFSNVMRLKNDAMDIALEADGIDFGAYMQLVEAGIASAQDFSYEAAEEIFYRHAKKRNDSDSSYGGGRDRISAAHVEGMINDWKKAQRKSAHLVSRRNSCLMASDCDARQRLDELEMKLDLVIGAIKDITKDHQPGLPWAGVPGSASGLLYAPSHSRSRNPSLTPSSRGRDSSQGPSLAHMI